MITRAQSKKIESCTAEAHLLDAGTSASCASVRTADNLSVSGTSSSSTVRARTLAIQAAYARKIADAERKALELELQAKIAQVEVSNSGRGSSRASHYSDRGNIVEWIENTAPIQQCSFNPCGSTTVDAHKPLRPGSSAPMVSLNVPVVQQPVRAVPLSAPHPLHSDSPDHLVAAPHHHVFSSPAEPSVLRSAPLNCALPISTPMQPCTQ
ncbi:hypothetical protein ACJJTC_004544, partial [Scirpophaga incertulas]